jgi:DNA-binding transcriptional ArsR family regulator
MANGFDQNNQEDMGKERLAYIIDRVSKLTRAVYRVTDILQDRDPVKWELRDRAVSALSSITAASGKSYFEKHTVFDSVDFFIDQALALLGVLSGNNTISSINFEILEDEYLSVKDALRKERQLETVESIIGKKQPGFLSGLTENSGLSLGSVLDNGQANGQQNNGQNNGQMDMNNVHNNQISDMISVPPEVFNPSSQTLNERPSVLNKPRPVIRISRPKNNPSAEERKNKVLEIVKERERVSVSEISQLFSGYSEKTIQRDLVELTERGLLVKEGDKRWRVYVYPVTPPAVS